MIGRPTWDEFTGKNAGRKNEMFEALARFLFRTRYGLGDSLAYFKNHPGNETATIQAGNEIVGFQAKFFENGKINPSEILNSLTKVEKGQTRQIIYTNSAWGNPPKGRNKTKGQIKIENQARMLGVELEWIYGDNILDQVQQYPLAYNIFFNLQSGLDRLQQNVERANALRVKTIATSFAIGNRSISIDRTSWIDRLAEAIAQGENVLLAGESGAGKSAIVKKYHQIYCSRNDYAFYIIHADQLNTRTVNDLFSLQENYTLTEFRNYFQDTEHKVWVIDSAEKILELNDPAPLMLLIEELNQDGWNFVFTCRDHAHAELTNLLQEEYTLSVHSIRVNRIEDNELRTIAADNGITLPDDLKLRHQLHLPFFLARYCERNDSGQLDLKTFRDNVWRQKVKGSGPRASQLKREHCLIEIVKRQLQTGAYYINYSEDYESAIYLVSAAILGEEPHKGFFINHDIYADWALDYWLIQELSDRIKVLEVLNTPAPPFRYVNAFKRWYAERLEDKSTETDYIGDRVFSGPIDQRWADAIMECIGGSAEASASWFDRHAKKLDADDYQPFNRFVDIVRVSCKQVRTIFKYNGAEYPETIPTGSGWEEIARFMDRHAEDYYMDNLEIVRNFLSDFYGYRNAKGEPVELGGKLALHLFQVLAEQRRKGECCWMKDDSQWSLLVCRYAGEIREELRQIFREVVANHWTRPGDPYQELAEYVATGGFPTTIAVSKYCYPQIISLLKTWWHKQPEEESDNLPFHPIDRSMNPEKAFGLNADYTQFGAYFPPSAFQTPVLPLLQAEFQANQNNDLTLKFIIDFMNDAVEKYSTSNYGYTSRPEIIPVTRLDGSRHEVIADQQLWCLYRGTASLAMPHVLESMHMALESHWLELLEENQEGQQRIEQVKSQLRTVLHNSRSASLYAIVASVAMSHEDAFTTELFFLMQDIRFFILDLHRYSRDFHRASSQSFVYYNHPWLKEERQQANEKPHRQHHLETVLLRMQATYSDRNDAAGQSQWRECRKVVERLKKQVSALPKKQRSFEDFILARIDYTSMRKEEITTADGQKAIRVTPVLTPEMAEKSRQINANTQELLRGTSLRDWIDKRSRGEVEAIKNNPYEINPSLALETLHETKSQTDENGLPINYIMDEESLPGMVGAILLTQLAERLTEDQKETCRRYVFDALSHTEPPSRSLPSDFEVILSGFPALLDRNDWRTQLQDLLITYAEMHEPTTHTRPCDIVSSMIARCRLWEEHADFMKETLHRYLRKLPADHVDTMTSDQALTLLSLLTTQPKDRKLGNRCIEKMASRWTPKEHSRYPLVKATCQDSNNVSEYILRSPKEELDRLITPFISYISSDSDHDTLLPSFVAKAAEIGAYDTFWIVWGILYDPIVKSVALNPRYYSQMLDNYLINPPYLTKMGDDWFQLEEKDVAFYARIAEDLPHHYTPLYAISRVFTSIGQKYVKRIIPVLALFVHGFTFHKDYHTATSILLNLETMMKDLFTTYFDDIHRNRNLHDSVVRILEFMKSNGSSLAATYLKSV